MSGTVTAIILAAGAGTRMNNDVPKQLLHVAGERLLDRAITPFLDWADQVIVALPADEAESGLHNLPGVEYIAGGATRTDSVRLALDLALHPNVFVHDAARPFVTNEILAELLSALDDVACAYPVMPVVNSIVIDSGGMLAETPSRSQFREVQTPQAFRTSVLREALDSMGEHHAHLPELVRRLGYEVRHTTGSPWLFKVTYEPSLYLAEYYVEHIIPGDAP